MDTRRFLNDLIGLIRISLSINQRDKVAIMRELRKDNPRRMHNLIQQMEFYRYLDINHGFNRIRTTDSDLFSVVHNALKKDFGKEYGEKIYPTTQ